MMLWLLALACVPRVPPTVPTPAEAGTGRCGLHPDGSRTVAVLHLNDIYRIEGLLDGTGGFSRVRTLRRELEQECGGPVLVTHAGDALSPSIHSGKAFEGRQMIDVINTLDGSPAPDPHLFATFGNHEFDRGDLDEADDLFALVQQSGFTWLHSNIDWNENLVTQGKLARTASVELHGLRVGLYSLTIDKDGPVWATIDPDYTDRSAELVEELAADHELVLALTHLDVGDDKALLEQEVRPHLVLGGHDHEYMRHEVGGRLVLKGDADARSVVTAWITLRPDGSVEVADERVMLGPDTPAPDPAVLARVDHWERALRYVMCTDEKNPDAPLPDCLGKVWGRTQTTLHASEHAIRSTETTLGNWLMDLARAETGSPPVAMLNSGSLRLNQDIPAGAEITERQLIELFPYPAGLVSLTLDGATLKAALAQGAKDRGSRGPWLQVSGIAFRMDADGSGVRDLHLVENGELRPISDDETLTVVTGSYMAAGNDGYTMLKDAPRVDTGKDLSQLARQALAAAEPEGIAPVVEGRICIEGVEGPCLLDR